MEFLAACLVIFCIITYWLGGQELPVVNKGYKWIRRYVLPIGLFIGILFLQKNIFTSLLGCGLLLGALHLGYQDKVWKYALTGLAMGIGAYIINSHWTCILPAIFHTLFGYLSLKDNKFRWAYVAILMGCAIGIAYTI